MEKIIVKIYIDGIKYTRELNMKQVEILKNILRLPLDTQIEKIDFI